MHTPPAAATVASSDPAAVLRASPPLMRGEQTSSYDAMLARVIANVRPADVIEEMWVCDIVDLAWDVGRVRRLRDGLLTANASQGLRCVLSALGLAESVGLGVRWLRREEAAVAEVDARLAEAGLTMDAVMAQTLALHLDEIERIEYLIAGAEARRNIALREIANHRAHFADSLRRATREAHSSIEDAAFEVVAPQTGQDPPGAGA